MMEVSQQSISLAEYRQLTASKAATVRVGRHKGPGPEELLQRACIEWVVLHKARYPILKWLTHVPNGGKRPKGEAGKLKAMGVKKGVPDLMLPRRRLGWFGLAIELKAPGEKPSDDQAEWLAAFEEDGWVSGWTDSLEGFLALMKLYLSGRPSGES